MKSIVSKVKYRFTLSSPLSQSGVLYCGNLRIVKDEKRVRRLVRRHVEKLNNLYLYKRAGLFDLCDATPPRPLALEG